MPPPPPLSPLRSKSLGSDFQSELIGGGGGDGGGGGGGGGGVWGGGEGAGSPHLHDDAKGFNPNAFNINAFKGNGSQLSPSPPRISFDDSPSPSGKSLSGTGGSIGAGGRGLHSSTSQLNLSGFGHTSPCPPV
jgi:hypothetical protein